MDRPSSSKNITPSADQPRATSQSLKKGDAPATLQYKVTSAKNANRYNLRKYGRQFSKP